MAQTQIVIIYSPNQNQRRTVIIPDDDSQIPIHTANIINGEAVLVGSLVDYQNIGPDAMLAAYIGQQPTSDRCILIDNTNTVVAVVRADPAIDYQPQIQFGNAHQEQSLQPQQSSLTLLPDPTGVSKVGDKIQ